MATINDLVLVHVDNRPGFFARIEDISPDVKKGWWQVSLLVLTVPMQIYTWILDDSQIDGAHFTMGGTHMMLEKVVPPPHRISNDPPTSSGAREDVSGGGVPAGSPQKVVFLSERKKKG